jgi:hypothetical protein
MRDFLRAVKRRGRRGVVVNLGCGRFVFSFFLFCFVDAVGGGAVWVGCGVCFLVLKR